ncbi:Non-histone chromosomal protein 6 [Bonamia ostreae]|uniref:Non-histone chromosomal protein 6 n=1 Tax=Bonamia ostreae TaxID=126728 RepID=A0ABV2AFG6_9EUKA
MQCPNCSFIMTFIQEECQENQFAAKNDFSKQTENPFKNFTEKPKSAFMIYCDQNRNLKKEHNPDLSYGEITLLLRKEWLSFTDSQRDFYFQKSKKLFG